MIDMNKERELFEEAYLSVGGKQRELELEVGEYTNSKSLIGWELWQIKAKAQAVPETHIVIPKEPKHDTLIAIASVCLGPAGSEAEFLNLVEAKDVYSALVESESGAEP